ncbi:MAG: hypothetical protein AABN34_27410 [Acidobacteriota bacterium]
MLKDRVQGGNSKSIKILFLGQCLQYGYQNLDRSLTFVALAISNLEARFPQLELQLDLKQLYHPKGLKAILRHRLLLSRPDIVVISVIGSFAAVYTRVNLLYEMAPEIVDTARSFLQKVEAKRSGTGDLVKSNTPIDKLFALHPPLALDEYERLIMEGIELCRTSACRVVLMGPGRFNEDTNENYAIPSPSLWPSVNEMVGRIGKSTNTAVIDVQSALSEHGGEVFLPNNIRWSRVGHQIVAREVERVLASQIMSLNPIVV